jgi:DNA modification methylase
MENQLILGDNLQILKSLPDESVDLIYIDPPFFSNRNYEVIWGDDGEIRSFQDRWSGGMDHYIGWLKERVEEMHRVLKPTGSMYLHCDWHADAYIRVQILDKVFGMDNFRGHIMWQRVFAHNDAKHKLASLKDSIFYYTKSKKCTYNAQFQAYKQDYLDKFYKFSDQRGVYQLITPTGPGINKNDPEWRGWHPKNSGRHWAITREIMDKLATKEEQKKMTTIEKLELMDKNGYVEFSKTGGVRFKKYLDIDKGTMLGDIWSDISGVQGVSKESIGYPTQKPEALLERIIKASSNEGDVVLDAFVGGGTTVAVADRLKRKWIGIDQSVQAIKVSEARINNQQIRLGTASRLDKKGDQGNLVFDAKPFSVKLHKYDYDTIRNMDDRKFEFFIIEKYDQDAKVNTKSNEYAIDGYTSEEKIPIQVKRSDKVGKKIVDNLITASRVEDKKKFEALCKAKKPVGIIIAFSFSKDAIERIATLKMQGEGIIELIKVEDIIPIAKKPKLAISFHDKGLNDKNERVIEFVSKAESDAEFYQWDFNYNEDNGFNAEIMIDKVGVQTYEFASGEYNIACKVVDVEGLESVESIKLKINGVVKQV